MNAQSDQPAFHPLAFLGNRSLTFLLVLVLGLTGYWLAPADLTPGRYNVRFEVGLPDQTLAGGFDFDLDQRSGQPVSIVEPQGAYRLRIESQDAFPLQLGSQILYRLSVIDSRDQPVELEMDAARAILTGPEYEQELPPTAREGEWLIFSMRVPFKAKVVTGLLFAVAVVWLSELVPLAAGAFLVPIVVVVAGVTDASTVLQPFAHPIIVLFLAGFLMAEGMRRTQVDRLLALGILRRSSLKPGYLMLSMMSLTAFLSMWMSNTASVAILIPIVLAVLEKIPNGEHQPGLRRALILGVAYAATIGGIGSAIGTPANVLALTFLNEFTGAELTFADWFLYGLPMVFLMIPITWLYLLLIFRVRFDPGSEIPSRQVYEEELREFGGLNGQQRLLLAVFVVIVSLWLTERWHHIPTAIVALGGSLALFMGGVIREDDLKRINWNALLTFGGGLSIGTILVSTGVSDWMALQLAGLAGQPSQLVILLVAGLTLLSGAFISNTAAAAMLIPLAIPLANIIQVDPRLMVAVVAIGSSIDFALVVGTPPTMMAYATGLFKANEIFRRGVLLDLIGLLVLGLAAVWVWSLLGIVNL